MMENVNDKHLLMSTQQIKAWCAGEIENIRFDADTSMLSYRLTSQPDSNISFKVPAERVERWISRYAAFAPVRMISREELLERFPLKAD